MTIYNIADLVKLFLKHLLIKRLARLEADVVGNNRNDSKMMAEKRIIIPFYENLGFIML